MKGIKSRAYINHGAAALGIIALLLFGYAVAANAQGNASTVQFRPIKDFIDAQGSLPFIPPDQASDAWTDPETMRVVLVDYTGHANRWIESMSDGKISLATEMDGQVKERLLSDGRVEVTVMLHTKNALTWAAVLNPDAQPPDPPWGELLFGYYAEEVLGGKPPVLGDSFFKWVFINQAPNAPLPDLLAQFILGPTVETIMLTFEASADGVFRESFGVPEGTPGHVQVTQTGPFRALGLAYAISGWPAEHIHLRITGRESGASKL